VESIEVTCYAMVSFFSLSPLGECDLFVPFERGREINTDVRFNLVNHNNHGVDVSKYEK
jgi:hypothetical protein